MSKSYFVFCAIYPVIRKELYEAEELVVWPLVDEDNSSDSDPVADAEHLLNSAPALARVFVVQAPDDRSASDCLHSYFAQHNVVPHSLTVLDLKVPGPITVPLQNQPKEAICAYHLPVLFAIRTLNPEAVESLHKFCWELVARDTEIA